MKKSYENVGVLDEDILGVHIRRLNIELWIESLTRKSSRY
jgi:hypothetical protein